MNLVATSAFDVVTVSGRTNRDEGLSTDLEQKGSV